MNTEASLCSTVEVKPLQRQPLCKALLLWLLTGISATAQLGITEVMSWASTNCSGCENAGNRGCRPDFWEVTNFGDTPIDLGGYLYIDKDGAFPDAGWTIEQQVIAQPGQSVIFFRAGWSFVQDVAAFRSWWGTNLGVDVQVICCYPNQGLDELGDAVRLYDTNHNLVDYVYFGETRRGFTFTYDTNSGAARQSELGVDGAFQAAACTDIGSPGRHSGPVALRIIEQPVCQTNDAGGDVVFRVRATGLPRPRYQWFFNGMPVNTTSGSTGSTARLAGIAGCGPAWVQTPVPPDLTLINVQPGQAGEYFVVISNGLERLTSAVVRLVVNTSPSPARVECPLVPNCIPTESGLPVLTATSNQNVLLTVMARGFPPPSFQWSWSPNGQDFTLLVGETSRDLIISDFQPQHVGIYCVQVQNAGGFTNACIRVVLKAAPRLMITEAMSTPCYEAAKDWWELTNLDDEPVNLCGYRWDDGPGNIDGGVTVNRSIVVQPGESVVLLEGQTPESFMQWWGASNLPAGLQFVSYTANGLESDGDDITLWNPTATDDADWVDSVVFSTAAHGASFWFDRSLPCPAFPFGVMSASNQCGAFPSALGCDVGSPGWTPWTPPRLSSIRRDDSAVHLEWKAQPGSTNLLQFTSQLASSPAATIWTDLGTHAFAGATGTALDTTMGNASQRFYRVRRVHAAYCPCPPSEE